MTTPKLGPLTPADFQRIWESTTDPSYWQPFELAGEGNGFEAHTQAWQQGARVSQAVDETTQALYILPWSGQTAPPASGAQSATVTLTLTRSLRLEQPLLLQAGTFVEEQATDWGYPEGVPVLTGRRYALDQTYVFEPGIQGPLTVTATAERPGTGYNNPQPGTISVFPQPGTGYQNDFATVRAQNYPNAPISPQSTALVFVDCANEADSFIPQHVGQYLLFMSGANVGKIARIVAYSPPNLLANPPTGGTVQIELSQSARSLSGSHTGTFRVGEQIKITSSATVIGYGIVLDTTLDPASGDLLVCWQKTSGAAAIISSVDPVITGQTSGATATLGVMLTDVDFTPENLTAAWLILDWIGDWGLTSTNAASPSGGKVAMLDALGKERGIQRSSPNEGDPLYAQRVATIADVVSPNAIRRTLNRVLLPSTQKIPWVFLETETTFPGFYFDQDAWDYDFQGITGTVSGTFLDGEPVTQTDGTTGWVATGFAAAPAAAASSVPGPAGASAFTGIVAPRGKFTTGGKIVGKVSGATVTPTAVTPGLYAGTLDRVVFGYENMRAWFYVILPPASDGEYGFAYDSYPTGAYDASPFDDFYDGSPIGWAARCLAVSRALDNAKAGGVGYDILQGSQTVHDPTATSAVA